MPKTLVIEIGVEEIPSSYIPPALAELERLSVDALNSSRIDFKTLKAFGTPRRLVVYAEGVAEMQKDSAMTVMGPPRSAAFDAEGKPTKAATGFAKGQGIAVENLGVRKTEKGEYVLAEVLAKGEPAVKVIGNLAPRLFTSLSFPKMMRWNGKFLFPRPIRWILALLGDQIVEFELGGVKSGRFTTGHRFLSREWIKVEDGHDYPGLMRKSSVIIDNAERKTILKKQIAEGSGSAGGVPVWDDELEEIVSFLIEYPDAVTGSFDPSFLKLPREVVVTAMREHQRYFAVEDNTGKLLPSFVAVTNGISNDGVRNGNERVLRARLDDALFYWEKDTREKMEKKVESLKSIVWQEGLGSLFEKTERLVALSGRIAELIEPGAKQNVERAAFLSKVDLVSEMVRDGKEFTSLEGQIGGRYAEFWGENKEVCQAIAEHYLPRGQNDSVPLSSGGAILSMADKMDAITGSFILGKIPTGSEDPYGLRRNANSILKIVFEKNLTLSLESLFRLSLDAYGVRLEAGKRDGVVSSLGNFFRQRMDNFLREDAFSYDTVDAVLSASFDDPRDARERCSVLREFRGDEKFVNLVIVYKRLSNILRGVGPATTDGAGAQRGGNLSASSGQEAIGSGGSAFQGTEPPDSSLFSENVESGLLDAAIGARESVREALRTRDYGSLIRNLLAIENPIHDFFEGVMVMDEDPKKRNARLELLKFVQSLFLSAWDLSKIVVEGEGSKAQ